MSCSRGCCESQREHYLSLRIAAAATPSRNGGVYKTEQKEKQLSKDMTAYKAMRQDGVQPKRIDGAADIEARAESKVEVESGYVLNDKQRRQFEQVTELGAA